MALAVTRDPRMSVSEFKFWAEPRPGEERRELLDGSVAVGDIYRGLAF